MDNYREQAPFPAQGLYDPRFEHENCGIGAVVNMKGETDRSVVDNALKIVETLEHRAGKDAEGKTGDGVGILLQISHTYFSKVAKEFFFFFFVLCFLFFLVVVFVVCCFVVFFFYFARV